MGAGVTAIAWGVGVLSWNCEDGLSAAGHIVPSGYHQTPNRRVSFYMFFVCWNLRMSFFKSLLCLCVDKIILIVVRNGRCFHGPANCLHPFNGV